MSVGPIEKEPLGYFFHTEIVPGYHVKTRVTCAMPPCIEAGECRAHDRSLRVLIKRARKNKQRDLSDETYLLELREAIA